MAIENDKHPLKEHGFIIPEHYMKNKFQIIDIMEDQLGNDGYIGFNKFMIIKYLIRADHNIPLEDYKKANYYLNNLIMYIARVNKIKNNSESMIKRVKPNHYRSGKIEAIDIIEDQLSEDELKGAYLGVTLKYIFRYKFKNGLEDLNKAKYYLDRLINYFESKQPVVVEEPKPVVKSKQTKKPN